MATKALSGADISRVDALISEFGLLGEDGAGDPLGLGG